MKPGFRTLLTAVALAFAAGRVSAHGPVHEEIVKLTAELELSPDDPARLARRMDLYKLHGLLGAAWADLGALQRLEPANPTNQLRRGTLELAFGRGADAARSLGAWAAEHPDDMEARLGLARALVLAGRPAEALPHFDAHLARVDSPRPETYIERARARMAAGAPAAETIDGLDAGIAKLGPVPALHELAAELESAAGRPAAAVERLGTLAAGSGHPERWWFRQGEIWLKAGKTNEARVRFGAAKAALDALPPRMQRTLNATELRRDLEARLAER